MSTPEPPTEIDALVDFPSLVWAANQPLARVHRTLTDAAWYSFEGSGRFDPPPAPGASFGTCYLSTHPLGAFVETFGRIRPIRQEHIDERVLTTACTTSDVRLADLTNPVLIGRFGLSGELAVGPDYAAAQRWAAALHDAGYGGIHYAARHDPSLESRSVALFGKPGVQPDQLLVINESALPNALIDEARARFGFDVIPAAPLF